MNPIFVAGIASVVLMLAFYLMRDYDWQEQERPPLRLRFADHEDEDDE